MMDIAQRWNQLRSNRHGLGLYALLDGARYEMRHGFRPDRSNTGWHALFDGTVDAQLAHAGPWLIDIAQVGSGVAEELNELEREIPAMSWLIAMQDARGLAQLLRLNLDTRMAGGEVALLRFWDPRVLADLVDVFTPQQLEQFIGPIHEWHFLRGGARVWIGRQPC
jgi:hypothetical protein